MKTVAFIPIKLNNERLPGKNLKAFDNGKPLIEYILNTALQVKSIDEVYVYCSNESICNYLPEGVLFKKRDVSLDTDKTKCTDFIKAFRQDVEADIYVLLHATAPFVAKDSIERGVLAVKSGDYDSALAVKCHYDFLWRDGKPGNYDVHNVPRTQDLEPFYTETSGFYIFVKSLVEQNRRIGDRPLLVEVSDIEATDIDEPIDFEIANAVFNYIVSKKETK